MRDASIVAWRIVSAYGQNQRWQNGHGRSYGMKDKAEESEWATSNIPIAIATDKGGQSPNFKPFDLFLRGQSRAGLRME